ncbi:hypothetical protein SNEBB_004858 [Seison nebaliae]|nr:hypothetical protein SNEBB_004858 [Seison nebaliae]
MEQNKFPSFLVKQELKNNQSNDKSFNSTMSRNPPIRNQRYIAPFSMIDFDQFNSNNIIVHRKIRVHHFPRKPNVSML